MTKINIVYEEPREKEKKKNSRSLGEDFYILHFSYKKRKEEYSRLKLFIM